MKHIDLKKLFNKALTKLFVGKSLQCWGTVHRKFVPTHQSKVITAEIVELHNRTGIQFKLEDGNIHTRNICDGIDIYE